MTTGQPVRVRFAPSPTGYFHVGGAKTALYNWIFARQHGGTFVLRIEDTDAERNRPEWIDGIIDAMNWLNTGLEEYGPAFDEGPYFQSSAVERHKAAASQLHRDGAAYYCDCSRDEIDARNATHKQATGETKQGYDGYCRARGLTAEAGRALRFRTPDEGVTVVADLIRGNPEFPNANLEDFVILRGNGAPMFILANVVDDIDMRITHVIRAEEHLPNTPKAQLLWTALGGGELPTFAHVPLLVNEKRQKLSKRRDPVALEMYREQGYLPAAMRNFLMTLGWAPPGDDEIVPWSTIMSTFDLSHVNSSPAYFDVTKLAAFNGEYIRALPVGDFIEAAQPWLASKRVPWSQKAFEPAVFAAMAPLVQERVRRLDEVAAYVDFLFLDHAPIDSAAWSKVAKDPTTPAVLDELAHAYAACEWNKETLKAEAEAAGERHGLKPSKAQAPLRVAVTGRSVGPPLYESIELLGRGRTLARVMAAREQLGR